MFSEPPGSSETCELCDWEDDPVQLDDPLLNGGANHDSLSAARAKAAKRFPLEAPWPAGYQRDPAWSPFTLHTITEATIEHAVEAAYESPRLRVARLFHTSPQENPQRLLNAMAYGTYIPPHRHLRVPKTESMVMLEGHIACFIFDNHGVARSVHVVGVGPKPERIPPQARLKPIARGIDIPAGLWHSIVVLTPHAVAFEVKAGPWDAESDRELAPWAPAEGDPEAEAYMERLLEL